MTIAGDQPESIQVNSTYRGDNPANDNLQLTFDKAIIFPGLVNSHDHLDFNLFPQMGSSIYNNYTEWGSYLHKNHANEIAAVLQIPLALRISWGIFKNLLSGVTTVVNHGEHLNINNPLINVEQCHCLHSVQFEKYWRLRLNNPLKRKQRVVIHTGEGTDSASHAEIGQLINWNLLKKTMIGVHGVAMTAKQAKKFEAVVWCPESNYFLLNKTAHIDELKKHTRILFGTDSTLTGNWNIWDHIRLARKTQMLTDEELYHTLNTNATAVWKMHDHNNNDFVVARRKSGKDYLESFFEVDPADILLVIHQGSIRLFDETLLPQLPRKVSDGFDRICINGSGKYVQGDLPGLIKKIKEYHPGANFPVTVN